MQLNVFHRKEGGIIEQGTVYATAVGTLHVYEFNITCAKRFLGYQVFKSLGILHLRKANDGTAHPGKHISAQVGKCTRHVLQLVAILQSVPTIAASGQKLIVVLSHIMASVEEVFLIVEAYGIHRELLLCRCLQDKEAEHDGSQ